MDDFGMGYALGQDSGSSCRDYSNRRVFPVNGKYLLCP